MSHEFGEIAPDVFILASGAKTPEPVPSFEGRFLHIQMDHDLVPAPKWFKEIFDERDIQLIPYKPFKWTTVVRDRYKYGPASVTYMMPKKKMRVKSIRKAKDNSWDVSADWDAVSEYLFQPFDY
jgi:hypothetical protein